MLKQKLLANSEHFHVNSINSISKYSVAILTMVLLPLFATAQSSNLGNWLIYIGNKKLNSDWNLHHEVQYRNYNVAGDLEQLLLRTGIGYNLSENNNNLLLGYGYILSQNYLSTSQEKVSVNEHRIYQQFVTKQKFNRFSWQHRYRLEERFVEEEYKMRFRYFLGINYSLNLNNEAKLKWYLSSYNELFINLNSEPFDRNRSYIGLGTRLSDQLKVEIGYMNQFFGGRGRDQINILALASF